MQFPVVCLYALASRMSLIAVGRRKKRGGRGKRKGIGRKRREGKEEKGRKSNQEKGKEGEMKRERGRSRGDWKV
jgi:hypothetical protein